MRTECKQVRFEFHQLSKRKVKARFDGGKITSDAGVLLLREVERGTGLIAGLAECFRDHRDARLIEHTVEELLGQRIYGLCLGYEDLNDHDQLRTDPMLAVAVNKADPLGERRRQASDRGKALASRCTLNRLELTGAEVDEQERYKKIAMDPDRIDGWMVDAFVESHESAPEEMVLDLDATDDPIHGQQEGRFFHGYYRHYCYLPLYIFSGEHLLCARLRCSNIDGAAGSVEELERIVGRIRQSWPEVSIVIRADSGFCRDDLLRWCEDHHVDYVMGLANNDRLKSESAEAMTQAEDDPQRQRGPDREVRVSTLPSAETVLRWYPRGNRILAQPDRDVPVAPEATLVLPPVPDSVLRLVLAVDSARLPCGHDVAPLLSMMDRNPPPMLACTLTPIHAPMPSLGTKSRPDQANREQRKEMSHSVRRHMRIEIDAYDETIRRYIPGYEVMLDVAAHELSSVGSGLVLDLGGGTGALSEVILTAGTGTVELIDVDREMLAHARKRLARFTGRVRFSERSFLAALPHCNGVAASLALHHIPAIDTKRALYRRIHDALGPAGVFVNADATMPAEPVAREATWRAWADYMVAQGVEERRVFEHFKEWAEEDTYFPLEEELAAVESAGFGAECVWHEAGMTVIIGRKGT